MVKKNKDNKKIMFVCSFYINLFLILCFTVSSVKVFNRNDTINFYKKKIENLQKDIESIQEEKNETEENLNDEKTKLEEELNDVNARLNKKLNELKTELNEELKEELNDTKAQLERVCTPFHYEMFYGEWQITDKIYVEPHPMREIYYKTEEEIKEEAKNILENVEKIDTIQFSPDSIVINKSYIISSPAYKYVVIPADENYRPHPDTGYLSLKDLGLSDNNYIVRISYYFPLGYNSVGDIPYDNFSISHTHDFFLFPILMIYLCNWNRHGTVSHRCPHFIIGWSVSR